MSGPMDEFVHWDKAAAAIGAEFQLDTENLDLVLENVDEDDFGFSALQHYSGDANLDLFAIPGIMPDPPISEAWYETPLAACAHCVAGAFSCKKLRQGSYKGYCTSCVALRVECSFAGDAKVAAIDPAAAFPPNPWPVMGQHPNTMQSSFTNLHAADAATSASEINAIIAPIPSAPPKIGARFSRESVRILKNWLSTHTRHPYPSEEEKEMLQRQTGLNKVQITNWLANARRRGKVQPPRSVSPNIRNWSTPGSMDIPQRRGTPALEAMNPLQRWQVSPPEHEPASVSAIARAVTASSSALSSGLNSPYSFNYTDDGSNRSVCKESSTSSLGTSQSSNGSFGSAYSHGSRHSWGSFGSAPFNSRGRRRRRRRGTAKIEGTAHPSAPLKTFQCTFCTETFRTKHDWQRHEKSLHLSLERWVCTPDGPRVLNPETGQMSCVFCGVNNPDDAHIDSHNHSACQERAIEERTFYRKDHLNQHLRLVHNVKFLDNAMKQWKIATPEIRSRCGFCGIVMDSWTIRVDHLAEHFKTGYSMADWKGDWGFEVPVLDMVENSIPPYLIHHERKSPMPYFALQPPPASPRNAYELIKLELANFGSSYWEQHGKPPTDDELCLEGCRIIFASELLSIQGIATQVSWLRDIVMNDEEISRKAKFGPLRRAAELQNLKINGKDNLFEECPMEIQLHQFVKAKRLLGLSAMDDELQEEACRIVSRVEEMCTHPSEAVANWLLRLIKRSTSWLSSFRRRAHLPRTEDIKSETIRSKDLTSIDSTILSYSRLERELSDYLKAQRCLNKEPSDEDLQRQARIIIYEFDDGWNQTAADNMQWLDAFKERHALAEKTPGSPTKTSPEQSDQATAVASSPGSQWTAQSKRRPSVASNGKNAEFIPFGKPSSTPSFLNDANCYRRLAKELRRWVVSAMSPNNPNRHVPTDDELRYQARWIIYDGDDPWNQTAADNAEWLQRFKRDVGITKDGGPGLPESNAWAMEQGGTGFAPPYACPKSDNMDPFADAVHVEMRDGAKAFMAGPTAANSFLDALAAPNTRPAKVFCSRELEAHLLRYAEGHAITHGGIPGDAALRAEARRILRTDYTAADDDQLLGKFKELLWEKMPFLEPHMKEQTSTAAPAVAAATDVAVALPTAADEDLDMLLHSMDFEFELDFMSSAVIGMDGEDGGAPLF
ncbi:homeobox and C2H2 transcription factor, putative [Cordyceps militaris CM01]|uniref:Homeobox and C2H2 transcription factor, putative n=1 Tax=Cordyceps militaris (strain CM01) TaxID=983644 RepID=G3JDV0_CORMM|nr:homeobox and C2H2 transcription factor, putative [Cordyceps militaris CM01]EGX92775.1 homeobox and C2H2 transcription factor, putative [Cordyceps militaris CM01]